jgi:N-acetylglutamate synthase-like GNAT family acetyltransferase
MTTTQDATLRPARREDLPAIERLLADAGLPLDGVAATLPHAVVAEHDGALVGVAGVEPCERDGLLRSVAVRPEWRARGLGRRLVERAIADAERRDVRALYLLTTTAETYFPRFGFAPVARAEVPAAVRATSEFREACPASATVMCRTCGTSPAP